MPLTLGLLSGSSALPLWILCSTLTIIVVSIVAAWLIRDIAHQALAKADPKDIPDVLIALSRLLDRFHGLLPWRREPPNRRKQVGDEPDVTHGWLPTDGGQ